MRSGIIASNCSLSQILDRLMIVDLWFSPGTPVSSKIIEMTASIQMKKFGLVRGTLLLHLDNPYLFVKTNNKNTINVHNKDIMALMYMYSLKKIRLFSSKN